MIHLNRLMVPACILGLTFSTLAQSEFEAIFDGQSLKGWETPDPSYWTVEEGAITGRITKEHPCTTNQYLVFQRGELADFELKLESRLTGDGGINNGFQFRSRVLPDHDICGYQMDNNLETPWLVRLYDEYGRHTLAWRGERAVFGPDGNRTVEKIAGSDGDSWFRLQDWHEYHLVCVGRRITLRVNGRLASEVDDQDLRRYEPQGVLALQLHSGPPTLVQFRNIRLKVLRLAERSHASVTRTPVRRAALRQEALAWWDLDTGGHGARPALRHVPDFEKFELNVRAAGPGARPGTDVVLMHGAYFKAAPELKMSGPALTVYLRARDPKGLWNAALIGQGGGESECFALAGVDDPATPGPDLAFAVRTGQGRSVAAFPIVEMDPTAWHDFVGRYDGQFVELYCDGKRLARQPLTGDLADSDGPLLIGAELKQGKPARFLEGELQEAAVWSRALTATEIRALSEN